MWRPELHHELNRRKVDRQKLDEEIAHLEKLLKKTGSSNDERLATLLHSRMCHYNHVDACDWEYHGFNKPGHSHQDYLYKAKCVIKVCAEQNVGIKAAILILEAAFRVMMVKR